MEQINVILQELQKYTKDNEDTCLQNVYISVPAFESLDNIEKQLNSTKGSAKESKYTGNYRTFVCIIILSELNFHFIYRIIASNKRYVPAFLAVIFIKVNKIYFLESSCVQFVF